MRIEIVLFLATVFIMANIYTDGHMLKRALSYKKYYQMAGVAFGAITLYVLLKKNPERAKEFVMSSHEYLKYMPVDRNTSNILNPVLDFGTGLAGLGGSRPILNLGTNSGGRDSYAEARIRQSGGTNTIPSVDSATPVKATKRSVSETKKKFVAARQGWKCGHCQKQLPAWFEVDHKIRLEHGGSNHIDNLVALCRDCHGQKTAMENL